jgi:hypothetical protein
VPGRLPPRRVGPVFPNWWLSLLTWLEVLGQLSVLISLLRSGAMKRWPSIFTVCALNLVAYPVLLSLTGKGHSYNTYFICYWALSAIQAALRLWIMADIVRSIPGISLVPAKSGLFFALLGIVLAIGTWATTFKDGIAADRTAAILFDRCVNIALLTLMLAILAGIKTHRFGWERRSAYIAWGAFAHLVDKVAYSCVLSFGSHTWRIRANGLDSICYISVLIFWSYCFYLLSRNDRSEAKPDQDSEEIKFAFLALVESQRKPERL